jgi:uncharacterized protein (DUF697 family)
MSLDDGAAADWTRVILRVASDVPSTREPMSAQPSTRAREITRRAARKAAATAATLALPPGPLRWITVLPELLAVWKLQAQMVSDIAAAYGREARLSREQMLYCLFRHTAAQAVRDLVVRVGERALVERAAADVASGIVTALGVRMSRKALGRAVAGWLPLAGALGVGAYAYYDTTSVARTAMALLECESPTPSP